MLVWDGLHEQIGEERLGKRSPLMTRLNGNGNSSSTIARTNGNGSGSGSASSTPSTGSPGDAEDDISKVSSTIYNV